MLAQSSDRRVVADSESTRMERGSNAMVVGDAGVSVTSGPFSATDAGGTAVLRASQSVQIAASAGEGATLSARSAAVSGGDVYVAAGSADPQEADGGDTALQMGSGLCGQFGCAHGTTQIRKSGSTTCFHRARSHVFAFCRRLCYGSCWPQWWGQCHGGRQDCRGSVRRAAVFHEAGWGGDPRCAICRADFVVWSSPDR